MIKYRIKIFSKNKQSIKFFFLILNKINQPKFYLFTEYKKQKTLIKKIIILKSPHVNKKAQSHFEYRIFSKILTILSYDSIKFLIFLKKLKIKLFPEIKIKINYYFFNKYNNNLLNFKNYIINSIKFKKNIFQKLKYKKIKTKNTQLNSKSKIYLNILDCYGELVQK